jgi:septal ring factor EnvC (AmiA/AmiB activator)
VRGRALLTVVLAFSAAVLPRLRASEEPRATATPPPSPASPSPPTADERLRQVRERREHLQGELLRLRGQEKSLLGDVERLEVGVRLRTEELREIQIGLQRTAARINETSKKVRDLTRTLDETRPQLAAHARALYKLGDLSYLRILLSVDRPSDIFRGYRFVTALARRDNERIAGFRASLVALAAQKAELERKTHESLLLRSQLEAARKSLDADRQRKTELLTAIVEKKEMHAAYVQELEEAEAKLRQLFDGLGDGEAAIPLGAFRGALPWPVTGKIRSAFGRHKHPKFDTYTVQNGIEIEAAPDTPVEAVHEGTVAFADRFRGYGLMVILDHGGKHHSLYAHLAEARVEAGQKIGAGQVLGTVGASGLEGPGLYFEMRFQGKPEDPGEWLKKAAN